MDEYEGLDDADEFSARRYLIKDGNGDYLSFPRLFSTLKEIGDCVDNFDDDDFATAEFVYRTAAESHSSVKIYITSDGPDTDEWGFLEARYHFTDDEGDEGIICSRKWALKIAAKFGGTIEPYD